MGKNTKLTDKESAIQGMNKMFYYSMNIPTVKTTYEMPYDQTVKKTEFLPDFIGGVNWPCDTSHIVGLWKDAQESGGYFGKIMALYSALDSECRRLLLEFICNNYNSEITLK